MSETTDKIIDKIVGDATSRLKIPIVSTYLCVLIITNWDILYFILFSKVDATSKILYVKNHYNLWDYIWRVGGSLIYAIFILVLFTFLDYYLVKWLKNVSIRKKGLQQQIIDHNTLEELKKVNEIIISERNELNNNYNDELNKIEILRSEILDRDNIINELKLVEKSDEDINKILLSNIIIKLGELNNQKFNYSSYDVLYNVIYSLQTEYRDDNYVNFYEFINKFDTEYNTDSEQVKNILDLLKEFNVTDYSYKNDIIHNIQINRVAVKILYNLLSIK
ncbi:hypothetical protein [Empedobacter brevis]|uniref:hypothetical protein n=1 Tax=Empedobacter brevis TaxID=247 RepID=UPI0028D530A4|nr:hypothetical protein [Empedobacter brevis]